MRGPNDEVDTARYQLERAATEAAEAQRIEDAHLLAGVAGEPTNRAQRRRLERILRKGHA